MYIASLITSESGIISMQAFKTREEAIASRFETIKANMPYWVGYYENYYAENAEELDDLFTNENGEFDIVGFIKTYEPYDIDTDNDIVTFVYEGEEESYYQFEVRFVADLV